MAITAAMVKELREKTGAGMMDCKKALTATDGDAAKAIDWLREKGIAKAEKKAGRVAAEGAVGAFVAADGKTGCVVEINCETDFAAGNDQFKELLAKIAEHIVATKPADLDALNDSEIEGKKVSTLITEATATIGEKISLRRFACYETEGKLASYIHMGGKIGVLVNLTGGDEQLGKDIAMQIAAAAPMAVDRDGVDASALEHEKEVLRKQAEEEGKPANIIERMVEGRINKFYKEVCLNEQIFVKDSEKTIKDVLGDVKVTEFTRFQLGEGIEKKQDDFAAEVAAQLK
ncbi:translation elongation factor Ts [Selenomonas ruminantium]|uniref:translation elongation factor Ts n=1 Tax=Selenomonas ruminantium TaxID=971 RepID=UPI0026EAF1DF|nr:translation elongation factor Ts [Selenomonas ruminantium]